MSGFTHANDIVIVDRYSPYKGMSGSISHHTLDRQLVLLASGQTVVIPVYTLFYNDILIEHKGRAHWASVVGFDDDGDIDADIVVDGRTQRISIMKRNLGGLVFGKGFKLGDIEDSYSPIVLDDLDLSPDVPSQPNVFLETTPYSDNDFEPIDLGDFDPVATFNDLSRTTTANQPDLSGFKKIKKALGDIVKDLLLSTRGVSNIDEHPERPGVIVALKKLSTEIKKDDSLTEYIEYFFTLNGIVEDEYREYLLAFIHALRFEYFSAETLDAVFGERLFTGLAEIDDVLAYMAEYNFTDTTKSLADATRKFARPTRAVPVSVINDKMSSTIYEILEAVNDDHKDAVIVKKNIVELLSAISANNQVGDFVAEFFTTRKPSLGDEKDYLVCFVYFFILEKYFSEIPTLFLTSIVGRAISNDQAYLKVQQYFENRDSSITLDANDEYDQYGYRIFKNNPGPPKGMLKGPGGSFARKRVNGQLHPSGVLFVRYLLKAFSDSADPVDQYIALNTLNEDTLLPVSNTTMVQVGDVQELGGLTKDGVDTAEPGLHIYFSIERTEHVPLYDKKVYDEKVFNLRALMTREVLRVIENQFERIVAQIPADTRETILDNILYLGDARAFFNKAEERILDKFIEDLIAGYKSVVKRAE